MDDAEEFRQRRDQALNVWRREAQRLGKLMKSRRTLLADLENQRKAIGEARELYDSLNEAYLNRIHSSKVVTPEGKTDHLVH